MQPPPTLPAPGPVQPVQPPTLQQQTGVLDPNATLAGKRGDQSDVDEVLLVAKPVLKLSGLRAGTRVSSGWPRASACCARRPSVRACRSPDGR